MNIKNNILIFGIILVGCIAFQPKKAYQIFDKTGAHSHYDSLLQSAKSADIILFGELHNNPISHWLQLELTQDLYHWQVKQDTGKALILGAEMFEADNQVAITEYLRGWMEHKKFEKSVRLWPNYETDYKPLMDWAKDNKLPFIATNIPRRYASMVFKRGMAQLDSLSELAKQWIAPLPISVNMELPNYKAMLDMMGGSHSGGALNFPHAQAVKDATMAHFILKNWQADQQFIHYNGAYHSNNEEGIVWYLQKQQPDLKILTVSTVEQANIAMLDSVSVGLADFVIAVPKNMTKTY